ncbi:MAG: CBS domain-containing protein [Thaumarchaeota archaeon]|nr:CBS domain-containing protein [Nitrososphaerota archaeon]
MPVKDTFLGYEHKELLNSKIGDMFDFENTLPTAIHISDNVIDCINVLKDDGHCHEGALVKSRDKHVGIITGRELTAGLLSLGVKKFVGRSVGDYFSSNYNTISEDETLLDFIQKVQRSRRGFGLVLRDKKLIGKLSIKDVASLYLKMNSSATLGDFPTHQMISVSPKTTIKESLFLMMKHHIRKIFLDDKLCPFISERNVLGLVARCASKNDYTTLDKPITECKKNYAITLKEEKIKDACQKLLLSNSTCIIYDKKYIFTAWDIATSFLVDRIHDYQKQLLTSEKLAMMGELSAKLNHELRNPLSIIKNSAELLKVKNGNNLNPEQITYIQMIDRAVARMAHQIDDVLDFVRITDLNITASLMSDLVSDALENIALPQGMSLVKNIEDHHVQCDKAKIRVVIRNLVLNAIDAIMEKKGEQKEIHINAKQENDTTVLEIRDTGVGISQRDLKRVFEPLYTTKQSGTGLGLAISKFIVDFHKGDISVSSKANEGTTVTIRLPMKPFGNTN